MATAFASLVSLQNTLRLIYKHPCHHFSFDKKQLGLLWSAVSLLIDFMRSFDDSYGAVKEAAEALESRIARAAQAAEDIVESHVAEQIRRGTTLVGDGFRFVSLKTIQDLDFEVANVACRIDQGKTVGKSVESDMLHLRQLLLKWKVIDRYPRGSALGREASRFLLDLQKAIEDVKYLLLKTYDVRDLQSGFEEKKAMLSATPCHVPIERGRDTLISEKNRMVGFDDELLRLLDLLTGVPSSRQVIPIVGMGGGGKTTLVTNAFQHGLIVEHFDVRLWATVSQEFSIRKILTELLSCLPSKIKEESSFLPPTPIDVSRFGDLGIELYKSLFGRRYLIVLDDMWSVEPWDKLKTFFPDTRNGSRIVVTTRQSNVADHLQNWRLDMRLLDEDNSWDLFCHKTFYQQGYPPELEDIGKKIVEKCKGLPLAISVIGGHLRKSPRTPEYWKNVANDMSSVFNLAENEECFKILSLSYRYLPVHLKPCFLSLGVFQEDQDIPIMDLLDLWVTGGFIEHDKNRRMEDVAMGYLLDLLSRNLILAHTSKRGSVVNTTACRVHDLVRELCLKIAKTDGFFSLFNARRAMSSERRVAVEGKIPETKSKPITLHGLKLLRALNEVDATNKVVFEQVNLRYLKIKVDFKSNLPSSVSLLWNLQTLIITGSIVAPYEFWEMSQLRHVEVDQLHLVDPLPIQEENELITKKMQLFSVMENLHTLSRVENFRLSEEVCRRIPNIQALKLSYCGESGLDYCPHNLGFFRKLELLECYFDRNAKWREFAFRLRFPNSPDPNGENRLDWGELGVKVGSLPNLKQLELFKDSVTGSEWTPVEGGFPRLDDLVIFSCDLIYWNAEKSHFPVLKSIYLAGLTKLDEFPSDIGEIPTLRRIVLVNCSMSASFSAMRMVVEQEEFGNEGLELGVILEGDEETIEEFEQKVEEEDLTRKNIHLQLEKLKTNCS